MTHARTIVRFRHIMQLMVADGQLSQLFGFFTELAGPVQS